MGRKITIPKTKARRRRATRPRKARGLVTTDPNRAACVEILPDMVINHNTPYIFSKAGITGSRASALAAQFGFYRIAKITYVHRPYFDTFSGDATGVDPGNPITVPQLYYQMNRYGDAPAVWDGDYIRSLGSKPIRFDDKNVTISYKPNMLMVGEDNAGNDASQVKMTPWISTDETPGDGAFTLSTAEHFGHLLYIDAAASAPGQVGVLDVQVHYEFKTPRTQRTPSENALPSTVHKL